jgi:hypothetical protein
MTIYVVVFSEGISENMVEWNEYVGTDLNIVNELKKHPQFYKVEHWVDGRKLFEYVNEYEN